MSDIKNREFVRTLHGMIADFLRDNPDIDRSYYQEIWDWLEKKEESEDERIRKEILEFVRTRGGFKGEWIAYLEKQKEPRPIINFPVFIEEKNIEQAIKKFLGESARFQKEQTFTHHEINESLQDAVTHQMEDDGDVDDFVRRGIDDIVLKYAEIGAKWQKEQKPINWTELNGKDIAKLEVLINNVHNEYPNGIGQESFGEEVLERFREYKGDEDLDEKEQKQAEWSEEDEKQLNWFYRLLDFIGEEFPSTWGQNHKGGKEWLKLLRSRPKPSGNWKPSKYMLSLVKKVADGEMLAGVEQMAMGTLYEQLKKL